MPHVRFVQSGFVRKKKAEKFRNRNCDKILYHWSWEKSSGRVAIRRRGKIIFPRCYYLGLLHVHWKIYNSQRQRWEDLLCILTILFIPFQVESMLIQALGSGAVAVWNPHRWQFKNDQLWWAESDVSRKSETKTLHFFLNENGSLENCNMGHTFSEVKLTNFLFITKYILNEWMYASMHG